MTKEKKMRLPIKLAIALLLFFAAMAYGAPIEGPASFPAGKIGVFTVKAKGMLNVPIPAGLDVQQRPGEWFVTGVPGTYTLSGSDYWVDFDSKKFGFDPVNLTFTIGDGTPVPPGPNPPQPNPTVKTNPFGDETPRILIMYDPLGPALTSTQSSIVYGADCRKAMEAFAPNDGLRIWPKGQASATKVWADALARPKASYPWIMVGKGKVGYDGPLNDATVTDFLAWLGKVGVEFKMPDVIYSSPSSSACQPIIRNGRVVGYSCQP
jgi:hypothetical protein